MAQSGDGGCGLIGFSLNQTLAAFLAGDSLSLTAHLPISYLYTYLTSSLHFNTYSSMLPPMFGSHPPEPHTDLPPKVHPDVGLARLVGQRDGLSGL